MLKYAKSLEFKRNFKKKTVETARNYKKVTYSWLFEVNRFNF